MYSSVPSPPSPWNPGPAPSLDRARTVAASPPPASPTSPTRRLRGLSYLRSYTQTHILSRDSHNHSSSSSTSQRPSTLARATSYPSPTTTPTRGSAPGIAASSEIPVGQTFSPAQRSTNNLPSARSSDPENLSSTSGWFPSTEAHTTTDSHPSTSIPPTALPSEGSLPAPSSDLAGPSEPAPSMGRTRSATASDATAMPQTNGVDAGQVPTANTNSDVRGMTHQLPSIRFTAHQDPRAQRPSLVFSPIARILPTGKEIIKVGRYSERDNQPIQAANVPSSAPVGFKSKVVSRRHCEFWCSGGRWFIKDVKSSSGTFLNHIRLSSPGTESRPFPVNDGDIVQLGIDFKGGEEMIFRCVKIRVELNKGWQNGPSSFNVQSHKRLRELNNLGKPSTNGTSQDCSICLGPIAPCQSLFVAPCSHTWHYKCIRVIINGPHWPHFICPNCRSVADLEAELDDPYANDEWEEVPEESENAVQPAETTSAVRLSHEQQDTTEDIAVVSQPRTGDFERERSVPSDVDLADTSDDSRSSQQISQATQAMAFLDIQDSPSSSIDFNANHVSNSTVAPVDIISRKSVSGQPIGSSHLGPNGIGRVRTPSPNGLPSSLSEQHMAGHEGPMTPRNDAGPFIFDGSAGRASEVGPTEPTTDNSMTLSAAADTPPASLTPRAAS